MKLPRSLQISVQITYEQTKVFQGLIFSSCCCIPQQRTNRNHRGTTGNETINPSGRWNTNYSSRMRAECLFISQIKFRELFAFADILQN